MKIVGEQLQDWAQEQKEDIKKDLFGRSAFNRYYYAAFLITRKMLEEIDPKWKKTPHKDIPRLLQNAVRKPVIIGLKQNARKGLIKIGESSALQMKLTTATGGLATLLTEAYSVRLIADYQPEDSIIIRNRVIMLSACTLTSASKWADRANAYCKDIRKVWGDSGLV